MKSLKMRENRRIAMLGDKNPLKRQDVRLKVSIANRGKKRSEGMKLKTSIRMMGNKYNIGKSNNKGKHWNIKDTSRMGLKGEKNPRWKGGISRGYRRGYKNDRKYKEWRSSVFQRDNWTCQTCGIRGVYLEPHHIKEWSNYPQLRYEIDNGVSLCLSCHSLTNNYRGKKQQ